MSKYNLTFYNYIQNNDNKYTRNFITFLGDSIVEKLPDKICSSKVLYNLLINDLDTYFKQCIFRETFMEYFKWKLLHN